MISGLDEFHQNKLRCWPSKARPMTEGDEAMTNQRFEVPPRFVFHNFGKWQKKHAELHLGTEKSNIKEPSKRLPKSFWNWWFCRARFGCDLDSDSNRAMRTARETSKTQTLRNKRPFSPAGSQESILKVPKRGQSHPVIHVNEVLRLVFPKVH